MGAVVGAIVGAAVGAVVGAAVGAMVGAVVGTAVGAVVAAGAQDIKIVLRMIKDTVILKSAFILFPPLTHKCRLSSLVRSRDKSLFDYHVIPTPPMVKFISKTRLFLIVYGFTKNIL